MNEVAMESGAPAKAPWHLWVVGVVALLWNAAGAYSIMLSQAGRMPSLQPDEAAYYAAQPTWFVAVTDVALIAAILAAAALLLRSRWAVTLFWVSIFAIAVTAGYDLAAGTSRMYANQTALMVTILIWILAAGQLLYALAMRKRGVLR